MRPAEETFQIILSNNEVVWSRVISRILILFEDKRFFIGDNFIRTDSLRAFRSYFQHSKIHLNFSSACDKTIYEVLLKQNPNIDIVSVCEWNELSFTDYDIVFCIMPAEDLLFNFLHEQYKNLIPKGQLRFAVFSMSAIVLGKLRDAQYVFPIYKEFVDHINSSGVNLPRELYIAKEEREWGNVWLQNKGVKHNEKVFILFDATTSRNKLLPLDVYFEFLSSLLIMQDRKILIFDENDIGKEMFYKEWLNHNEIDRIIFAKNVNLRETFSILSSSYVRLIFGPCTGPMHCASGIYNFYLKNSVCTPGDIPLIITYTGQYPAQDANAAFWWKNSPLVNCLLLRETVNGIELVTLDCLSEDERRSYHQIACSEYTSKMLIDFVNDKI